MLFNSLKFLVFFPVVVFVYFLLPHKWRWAWLLGMSCVFYMAFVPVYIFILGLTIVVDYLAALLMERQTGFKRKLLFVASLISTLLILIVFKYLNFFSETFSVVAHQFNYNVPSYVYQIILPVGLSFHTFQSMAYVIEVYRGNQKAEKNFGIYSLYVMFYPQLVAGPIERPQNLIHQFYESHNFNYNQVTDGLKQMAWGFFKKLVLADRLAVYVNEVFNNPGKHEGFSVIVATVFFAYQVYCDFSGYSDIAIGAARVMGFRLMKNFDRPFISHNITEFWRRWHISLSSWFNDYLFQPLMTSTRNWKSGAVFSLTVVFLLAGLWHGARWTFIVFGMMHGVAMIYEYSSRRARRRWAKKIPGQLYGMLSTILTFSFLCFTWIFFRSVSMHDAFSIISSLGHLNFSNPQINIAGANSLYFLFAGIIVLEIVQWFIKNNEFYSLLKNQPRWLRISAYHLLIIAILAFGNFNNTQFIYFQF